MRRFAHSLRLAAALRCSVAPPRRGYVEPRSGVSEEEMAHLDQEIPPRDLLTELRTTDASPNDDEGEVTIPGDSFGIMRNRVAFYKPIPRSEMHGRAGELMPPGIHPYLCVNQKTINLLCGRYGVSVDDAVHAMRESQGDINVATKILEDFKGEGEFGFGSYGVVCMESYAPETFCLVSYNLRNFAATTDDDVLDVIHELTLSAAELPLDVPRAKLVDKFVNHWSIEDETPVRDILEEFDITVKEIVLLPFGDYGVQGFHILHPVKPDSPNIGTAASACCMDLRTGIHNRFRFHVERIADSVSEHVLRETVHYSQGVHVLRQPYWFRPEYSVEEFIRFKESLLQPSASTYEMRYAAVFAPQYGIEGYRNIVEAEKLKIAQHKYEKHYEDFTAPGNWITSDGAQLQTVAAGSGGANAPGGALHSETNEAGAVANAMETRTGPLRRTLEKSIQAHGDRVFARFYRNNYH